MADLDLQDDDAVLRERLGRLASGAARSVGAVEAPDRIRHRGTARRRRRTAAGVASAGLAVLAVGGVVSGSTVWRSAPADPATRPSVSVTAAPRPTAPPSPAVTPTVTVTGTPSTPRTPSPAGSSAASPTPYPAPAGQVAAPWGRPGAEFGLLTSATLSSGRVVVTYTKARYLETGGGWTDVATAATTATALPGAYLSGGQVLAPDVAPGKVPADGTHLTATRFVSRVQAALARKQPIPVWLFRSTSDPASPLAGIQEQYRP
jgi:hypothetical protein